MKDKQKMILDPACGGRMFYFNKNDDRVLFCDIRNETYDFGEYGEFKVGPDMQIDFTNMPFDNESFKMIIFDPPHLLHSKSTPTGYMKIKYGYLHRDSWKEVLTKGFNECFRVLKAGGGVLIFKWSEVDIKTSEILKLTPQRPLIGQRNGKRGIWIVFIKE